MIFVIAKLLIALLVVIAGTWWEYSHAPPTLQDIKFITLNGPLFTHQKISTCSGISVWVSGKKLSYHYEEKRVSGAMLSILTVTPQKSVFGKPKPILFAVFRDDIVEQWTLADGKKHDSVEFPEWHALQAILLVVRNMADLRRGGRMEAAAHHHL